MFLIFEFGCVVMLFYYYFSRGSPLALHAQLSYGNGDSWLYGYGRPTSALVFICLLGIVSDMHPFLRWFTMVGCGVEIMGDAISAYQIHDYYNQIRDLSAPSNGYSPDQLMSYYWRDIVALGVSTTTLMLIAFLTCIVGWCPPQLIHPAQISGYDLDRYEVMRTQRNRRRQMEQRGFLGAVPAPFHRVKPTISAMLLAVAGMPPAAADHDAEGEEEEDEEKRSDDERLHDAQHEEELLL